MKKILILIIPLLTFSCCRFNENKYVSDPDDIYKFLTEDMYKKVKIDNYNYVFYVDSTHPYSYTLKFKLKEIKGKNYKNVTGKCEVYLFSIPSYINMVFEIRRQNNIIYWNSKCVDSTINSILKWSDVEFSTNINIDTLLDNDEFKYYLWSAKNNPCYIGKMTLIFK